MSRGHRAAATALLLCATARGVLAQGEIAVAGGIGVPGGAVSFALSLSGVGAQAVAADAAVQFDSAVVSADFARCRLDPRLSATHGFGGRVLGSTIILSIFARGLPPLPVLGDGALASCELRIRSDAAPGQIELVPQNVAVADGNGENIPVTAQEGRVLVLASVLGDANCDTDVDASDLDGLIGAIFDAGRGCPSADVNRDGLVGAPDLPALVSLLGGSLASAPLPRPAAVVRGAPSAVTLDITSLALMAEEEAVVEVAFTAGDEAVAGLVNDIRIPDGIEIPGRSSARTTLAADVGAADLTIEVADASQLPDFGIAVVDSERVGYSGKDGNVLIVAARGRDDTTAAPHAAGTRFTVPFAIPDCLPTEELAAASKQAVFSYLPDGCTPGEDCTAVRAVMLSLDDVAAIPSGIALYRCRVIAGAEEGAFPLRCANADAARVPAVGGRIAPSCSDGLVAVGETGLSIARVSGVAGTNVDVPVEVRPGPASVGALNLDVLFDPERLSAETIPCSKAPRLTGHRLTQSRIEPGRVRLVIFGLDAPVPPITRGAVASCRFAIAGTETPGAEIALAAERIQIADVEGVVVCGIGSATPCAVEEGAVVVVPAPTPTPTATPRPTATRRPCGGDCDGDFRVSIDELMLAVDIGHGLHPLGECPSLDASADARVDVAEVVRAVRTSIAGCP